MSDYTQQQLGNTLWAIADKLRGAMNADDFRTASQSASAVDALVTAEAQKLEALKTNKKGLMQQLFPSPEDLRP